MLQREAEQNAVLRFGPADRFTVAIRTLFLMASLATAGVGLWLCWVIAVVLPVHDSARIPMWRTVAVCFFVYSALSGAFLIRGPRNPVLRWALLAASVLAMGVGLYGMVQMVVRAFAGADVEGYIMLMGLILCGHGFVAIVYTLLTGSVGRQLRAP